MKKSVSIVLSISFLVYIFTMSILIFVIKDTDFSELENRKLAQKPKVTFENIKTGKFEKQFDEYVADQFPFRNGFITIKSYSELALQKKDNNGVYIADNGYFMEKFDSPDMAKLDKNVGYINKFSEKLNVSFLLAPTATKILEDKLPPFSTPFDEQVYLEKVSKRLNENINFVNLLPTLTEKKNEYIYYKTDHHWTTLGAYYSYVEYAKSIGLEPLKLDDFNIKTGSDKFYGSLFSKGNFSFATPDTLQIFEPKKENTVKVQYVAEEKVVDTMYEMSHLKKKDKYSVFLDNNHPVVVINSSVKNGKKLLVVKDSYANSFIPFLTNHFEEIHVLDLRFLNMPISKYAEKNGIEDVLFLYNVQNFAKETSLALLK